MTQTRTARWTSRADRAQAAVKSSHGSRLNELMSTLMSSSPDSTHSRFLVGRVIDQRRDRLTGLKGALLRHERCEWSLTPAAIQDQNTGVLRCEPGAGAEVVSIQAVDSHSFVRITTDLESKRTVVCDHDE